MYLKMASTLSRFYRRTSLHLQPRFLRPNARGQAVFRVALHNCTGEPAPRRAAFSTSPPKPSEVVQIPIDGETHAFSALLLRDLCECPQCVHESTKQRLFSTADIPRNISGRATSSSDSGREAVGVDWDIDAPGFQPEHRTEVGINTLRDIASSGVPSGPSHDRLDNQVLWDAQSYQLPTLDYESYMHNDAALYQAIRQLRTHGLIFIENVPGVEQSVSAIAERIGPVKDTFYGHTWDGKSPCSRRLQPLQPDCSF